MTTSNPLSFGPYRAHQVTDRALIVEGAGLTLALTPLTDRLLRVRAAAGGFAPRRSWDAARADADFAPVPFTVEVSEAELVLRAGALAAHVDRASGRVALADGAGRRFAEDAAAPEASAGGPVRVAKQIAAGEHFYGFGERGGLFEKTNRRLVNWTTDPANPHGPAVDPMYIAIPIYLAVQPGLAYGVFFHNTFRSVFEVGRLPADQLLWQADGGEVDYYVAYGPTPAEVAHSWAALLGVTPLPPYWALGHHQSRWSYMTADEIRAVAAELRRRELPSDAIHFDIDYMRGFRVFTWDPARFPDPAGLVADLRRDDFHAVTIIDPGVKADPAYAVYQSGLAGDHFIRTAAGEVAHGYVWPDDSVFPDFMRPETRAWWGEQQRALTEAGVSGVWNDMNEPVVFDKPFSEGGGGAGTLPLEAPQGPADERTTHAEVHNLYGLHMARASYEGLRRLRPEERSFTLTRSAYAGIQRWAACWMGDNSSWWEHLELALPQLFGMGLSGVPYVGVDIGGFGDHCTGELLARWIQLGALLPFCRNHASAGTARQEPWVFGPQVEAIYRDYLSLRYRLLPYLYSLFWDAHRAGAPILRPLVYHYPDDPAAAHIQDQALLGPALLAAPILRPGQTARAVYLPEGEWFDWYTGARHAGGRHILADAPLERMPLYARAGSLIPLAPVGRSAGRPAAGPLTLRVFPGAGEFSLYEDDGASFAYERGDYCVTQFVVRPAGEGWRLSWSRAGRFAPPTRPLLIQLTGLGNLSVTDDGQPHTLTL